MEKVGKKKLKTGFTTGTSATAAAKAALLSIIKQTTFEDVEVKLPKGKLMKIPIHLCEFQKTKARCSVIKDGGDDPDVTHGAKIIVDLFLTDKKNEIEIDGGEGVGIVTKPGLGLEINKAAINPVPKKMIKENLIETAGKLLLENGIKIIISVPDSLNFKSTSSIKALTKYNPRPFSAIIFSGSKGLLRLDSLNPLPSSVIDIQTRLSSEQNLTVTFLLLSSLFP